MSNVLDSEELDRMQRSSNKDNNLVAAQYCGMKGSPFVGRTADERQEWQRGRRFARCEELNYHGDLQ